MDAVQAHVGERHWQAGLGRHGQVAALAEFIAESFQHHNPALTLPFLRRAIAASRGSHREASGKAAEGDRRRRAGGKGTRSAPLKRHFELEPGLPGLDRFGAVLDPRAAFFGALHCYQPHYRPPLRPLNMRLTVDQLLKIDDIDRNEFNAGLLEAKQKVHVAAQLVEPGDDQLGVEHLARRFF